MDSPNTMIWVNGRGSEYTTDSLDGMIHDKKRELGSQVYTLEKQINSFHQKDRKGRKYWYMWKDKWVYVGPVRSNYDPRTEIRVEIAKLKELMKKKEALMKSCVIKKLGPDHLLVDITLFKKHVARELPENHIKVKDVAA